jgi:hypothetical protein
MLQANAQKGDAGHQEVMQAYEYVLGRLGSDSEASTIWIDFIDFLTGFPPSSNAFRLLFNPEPGKAASKRALRLRELYQKALQVTSGFSRQHKVQPGNDSHAQDIRARSCPYFRSRTAGSSPWLMRLLQSGCMGGGGEGGGHLTADAEDGRCFLQI